MDDLIVYFGLPDLIVLTLVVILAAELIGWALGRRGRKSLRWVAELLDGLAHGAVIVRQDGHVVLANSEAGQLWHGATFPKRLRGPLADLVKGAQDNDSHSVHSLAAPSRLRLQVRVTPLPSGLALLVLEDLTARQRQDAFYRNFVSNVSHELKTPLTVIQGHVSTLGDSLSDGDPRQTSLHVLSQEATRLTQLVDNLLVLSRLEMPDFSLDRRPVNLEAVIEDAILQLSDAAEARNVSLGLHRVPRQGSQDSHLPRIMADRARLKQVFINLLDNAIKYNRQGGEVLVRLRDDGARVLVQVTDTGEGIPEQDLPHIFEKLYRVERRQGRPVEGSGLGLSIVRRIVEQHQGSLSVESRLGEGTTFTINLPH